MPTQRYIELRKDKAVTQRNINNSTASTQVVHTDRFKSAPSLCGQSTNSVMHVLIYYWRGKRISTGRQQKEKYVALSSPRHEKALRDLWQHDAYFNKSKKRIKEKGKLLASLLGIPCHCEESVPAHTFKVDPENHLRQPLHALESVNNFNWMK